MYPTWIMSLKTDEPALSRLIFRICCCPLGASNQQWFIALRNHIAVDNDFLHIRARWDFVHYFEQYILDDTAQPSRSRALLQRAIGCRVKGVLGKYQFNPVKL